MEVKMVYDKGQLFGAGVLSINHEDILSAFQNSIANLTSLSLSSGYITKSAAPHLMINAFKNLCSVSFASDYSFPAAEKLKDAAKNTVNVAASNSKADDKPAEKEEEPEEEEELNADCGNLFGDDDY